MLFDGSKNALAAGIDGSAMDQISANLSTNDYLRAEGTAVEPGTGSTYVVGYYQMGTGVEVCNGVYLNAVFDRDIPFISDVPKDERDKTEYYEFSNVKVDSDGDDYYDAYGFSLYYTTVVDSRTCNYMSLGKYKPYDPENQLNMVPFIITVHNIKSDLNISYEFIGDLVYESTDSEGKLITGTFPKEKFTVSETHIQVKKSEEDPEENPGKEEKDPEESKDPEENPGQEETDPEKENPGEEEKDPEEDPGKEEKDPEEDPGKEETDPEKDNPEEGDKEQEEEKDPEEGKDPEENPEEEKKDPGKDDPGKEEEDPGKEEKDPEEDPGKEEKDPEEDPGKEEKDPEEDPGKEEKDPEEDPGKEEKDPEEDPGKEEKDPEEDPGKEEKDPEEDPGKEEKDPEEDPGKQEEDFDPSKHEISLSVPESERLHLLTRYGISTVPLNYTITVDGKSYNTTDENLPEHIAKIADEVSYSYEYQGKFKNLAEKDTDRNELYEVAKISDDRTITAGYSGAVKIGLSYKDIESKDSISVVVPGDVDCNGSINISDITIIAYLLRDKLNEVGDTGEYFKMLCDLDGNGEVKVSDMVIGVEMMRNKLGYNNSYIK